MLSDAIEDNAGDKVDIVDKGQLKQKAQYMACKDGAFETFACNVHNHPCNMWSYNTA